MDNERLKGDDGGNYRRKLFERIRDIRSSEKVLYRRVFSLYTISVDYDPRSEDSVELFKIMRDKLHFVAHDHVAAGVAHERADSEKPFMGPTTFSEGLPASEDISIAKDYLSEEKPKILNNFVSGYFDLAEIDTIEHKPVYMKDYVDQLDVILLSGDRKLLAGYKKASHYQAVRKVEVEYRKYQKNILSPVE